MRGSTREVAHVNICVSLNVRTNGCAPIRDSERTRFARDNRRGARARATRVYANVTRGCGYVRIERSGRGTKPRDFDRR